MDKYRIESAKRFGICLRELLKSKYPYLRITSVFLAEQYNLRSNSSHAISNETARKWLNGTSLPSVHRFHVLHTWLGIDYKFIAKYDDIESGNSLSLTAHSSLNDLTNILTRSNLFDNHQIDFVKNTIINMKLQ